MNTWRENLFILQAIRACLDFLPTLLDDEWLRYQSRLMYWSDLLTEAQSHSEVSWAVDALLDELSQSPAAGLVREIVEKSTIQPDSSEEETLHLRFNMRRSVREIEIPISIADDDSALDGIIGASNVLALELRSLEDLKGLREDVGPRQRVPPSNVAPTERRISAWIVWSDDDTQQPLKKGEVYELDFKVGAPVNTSIISGPDSEVPSSDIPDEGLKTRWVVISPAIYLHEMPNEIPVTIRRGNNLPQVASFTLLIPKEGDSVIVRIGVELPFTGSNELNVIVYAWPKHGAEDNQEIYRQFNIKLPVDDSPSLSETPETSLVEDEAVYVPAAHLNLDTTHEWTTPPGKLNIAVTGPASAYVVGTAGPYSPDQPTQWYGVQGGVKGPFDNVRASAEKFRGKWESYLNDIDPQDLINSLQNFSPQYDWANLQYHADTAHEQSWLAASSSTELYDLAFDGYSLYEAFFPAGSELRMWLDALTPGWRLSISWVRTSGAGWIAHVPWGLMYQFAPIAGSPIDPIGFLGLRYRISYTAHVVQAPSRALGAVDSSHTVTLLYWGQQAQDPTAIEAQWQKSQLQSWPTQVFVPSTMSADTPKIQLVNMLSTPSPSPVALIYFFCQCSVGSGNDPVLRFGDTSQVSDVLRRTELAQKVLADRPIVFANACTTATSDPYIANELERVFFNRQCRAYIGTESKVPIPLASRVAYIFLKFFYRKVDPKPMPAGEALAQTRLFLWTQYKNIGGLFYTYINQYDLYMATDAEVLSLKL